MIVIKVNTIKLIILEKQIFIKIKEETKVFGILKKI